MEPKGFPAGVDLSGSFPVTAVFTCAMEDASRHSGLSHVWVSEVSGLMGKQPQQVQLTFLSFLCTGAPRAPTRRILLLLLLPLPLPPKCDYFCVLILVITSFSKTDPRPALCRRRWVWEMVPRGTLLTSLGKLPLWETKGAEPKHRCPESGALHLHPSAETEPRETQGGVRPRVYSSRVVGRRSQKTTRHVS